MHCPTLFELGAVYFLLRLLQVDQEMGVPGVDPMLGQVPRNQIVHDEIERGQLPVIVAHSQVPEFPKRELTVVQRVCEEEEVLWSPSCSCFPLQTNKTLRPKSDLVTPCQDGERLVVSPYGEGICLDIQDQHEEQVEERLKIR